MDEMEAELREFMTADLAARRRERDRLEIAKCCLAAFLSAGVEKFCGLDWIYRHEAAVNEADALLAELAKKKEGVKHE